MALARNEVEAAWDAAKVVREHDLHPYLVTKGITEGIGQLRVLEKGTHGLTRCRRPFSVEEDTLLVPMHVRRQLVNVQRIFANGEKRYWPGALVTGAGHVIGAEFYKETKVVYLCEGWATGWSISQVTRAACVVAFSVGGLLPIARRIREKHPEAQLIIAADNDRWSRSTTIRQTQASTMLAKPPRRWARKLRSRTSRTCPRSPQTSTTCASARASSRSRSGWAPTRPGTRPQSWRGQRRKRKMKGGTRPVDHRGELPVSRCERGQLLLHGPPHGPDRAVRESVVPEHGELPSSRQPGVLEQAFPRRQRAARLGQGVQRAHARV